MTDRLSEIEARPLRSALVAAVYANVVTSDEAWALVNEWHRLVARVRELETALDRIEGEPEDPLAVQAIARAALAPAEPALPCGHSSAVAVHAGEGTSYCGACAAEQEER